MNRRFPSDFFFPQKEQTGSRSEPEPDRSQDTTRPFHIGLTLAGVICPRMYVLESDGSRVERCRPLVCRALVPRSGKAARPGNRIVERRPAPARLSGDEQADAGVEAKLAPPVKPDGNLVGGATAEPSVDLEGHPRALLVAVRKFRIDASFDTDDRSLERERSLAKRFGAVLLDGAH
jgi:hypothetical protein